MNAKLRATVPPQPLTCSGSRPPQAIVDGIVADAENRIGWCNKTAERPFGLDLQAPTSGSRSPNLVRTPAFLNYPPCRRLCTPVAAGHRAHADRVLRCRAALCRQGQLLQVRDVDRCRASRPHARDFVANVSYQVAPLSPCSAVLNGARAGAGARRARSIRHDGRSGRPRAHRPDLLTLSTLESAAAARPRRDRVVAAAAGTHPARCRGTVRRAPPDFMTVDGPDLLGAETRRFRAGQSSRTPSLHLTAAIDIRWQRRQQRRNSR